MSEPPTLLVRESDDDRTLIDPIRLYDPDPPFAGSGRAAPLAKPNSSLDGPSAWVRSRWHQLRPRELGGGRRTINTRRVLLLALVLGLGSVAYQQWRTAGALREAIVAIKTRTPVPLVDARAAAGAPTSVEVGTETRLEVSTGGIDASGRGELELHGANLVASNNYVGALAHYQTLTKLFPAESVFRDVVTALRAKLRCAGRSDPSSHVCP